MSALRMRWLRIDLAPGKQIEVQSFLNEIRISYLDWTPLLMKFPHWPAPARMMRGLVWAVVITGNGHHVERPHYPMIAGVVA